jgi:hypothetical protein
VASFSALRTAPRFRWVNMPSLYTIIMEYSGGTYISQCYSESEVEVLMSWARNFDFKLVPGIGNKCWVGYVEATVSGSNSLVALSGCTNVWCSTGLMRGKLVLVNIVKTERQ